jgi:chromosome segregation ATPase
MTFGDGMNLDELQDEVEELESELIQIDRALENAESEIDYWQSEKWSLESRADEIDSELETLRHQIAEHEGKALDSDDPDQLDL